MDILACSVDGCEFPSKARGYCSAHYQRVKKYGSPGSAKVQRRYFGAESAFAAYAMPNADGHIYWTGPVQDMGYGVVSNNGRSMLAHRYAWERVNGPIPEGLVIDHRCRLPLCVNVSHLRAVTQKQNTENVDKPLRGLTWDTKNHKWRVKVTHNYRTIHVGRFADKDEAVAAAKAARLELFTCNDADRAA